MLKKNNKGKWVEVHSSHQSGLDIDIPYIGNDSFDQVIEADGRMKADFDYSRNWQFLRVIAVQKITKKGIETSILNRVFVNPLVKKGLCRWANNTGILKNPLDAEIMRKIRPESGHDKHFHLRLRCSPYHAACLDQTAVPDTAPTGC